MYWHGDWQDLCRGPHLQNTGQVPGDAFKLMSDRGCLLARRQRPRDAATHLRRGLHQQRRSESAPAYAWKKPPNATTASWAAKWTCSTCKKKPPVRCFWHPNGWTDLHRTARLHAPQAARRRLCRGEHPPGRDRKLWEASGHWEKYQENMFIVEVDEEHAREKAVNALKPMNCPCHVQIFNQG